MSLVVSIFSPSLSSFVDPFLSQAQQFVRFCPSKRENTETSPFIVDARDHGMDLILDKLSVPAAIFARPTTAGYLSQTISGDYKNSIQ
jgi:hypothetical protein